MKQRANQSVVFKIKRPLTVIYDKTISIPTLVHSSFHMFEGLIIDVADQVWSSNKRTLDK